VSAATPRPPPPAELRIGVSACLLGERVRWDGGHRRSAPTARLARLATLVPVCPEVEAGTGTPRPPIQLARIGAATRLREVESGRDHTRRMRAWAETRVAALAGLGLSGFVLKSGSPSCGLAGVEVAGARGAAARRGVGLFAAALRRRLPGLPLVEERQLEDPLRRDRFLAEVRAYREGGLSGASRRGRAPRPSGASSRGTAPRGRAAR